MITVHELSHSFGGKPLLENVSLQIGPKDRIGLIGPNGAGKSTLFSFILAEATPDQGSIAREKNLSIGFLPQESAPSGNQTILQLATSVTSQLEQVYATWEAYPDENTPEHQEATELFAEEEGYRLEVTAKKILAGLAFRPEDYHRPAKTMSGGWIMRAHLARLLVMEPDLLMLDEPTNHLDLESLGWFQRHLSQYRGAIVTISHDRAFLNAICRSIVELRHQQLHSYRGGYDDYLREKKLRQEQYGAAYKNQQREIAELERFINRFRAKASKASQAQDRIKQLARMKRLTPPEEEEKKIHFHFPQPPRSGERVVNLEKVDQAYDTLPIYRDLTLSIGRGERKVLVGPNGAGKSTLLKIIAGLIPIQSGSVTLGHHVSLGYFAQQRTETLDPKRSVLAEAQNIPRPASEQETRNLLGSFLFRGEDVLKPVGVLSGGEKSRLALVKLLLNPPNLLLLDEPTTHLDLASIDALIGALHQYQGTLLFVSHDLHFIRSLATSLLHISAGKVTPYLGGYDYYLEKSAISSAQAGLISGEKWSNHSPQNLSNQNGKQLSKKAPSETEQTSELSHPKKGLKEIRAERQAAAQKRREQQKKYRELMAEITTLENSIAQLESSQKLLEEELEQLTAIAQPSAAERQSSYSKNVELATLLDKLESKTTAWAQAQEKLEYAKNNDQEL